MDVALLHTTELGAERIRRNLGLETHDVVAWCRQTITDLSDEAIETRGKNYYVKGDGFVITINRHSHTIITAHKR